MKRRNVILLSVVTLLIGVAAWYVFLVIEPFKGPFHNTGSSCEGAPWGDTWRAPFEGAILVARYYDEFDDPGDQPEEHTWLYQVLIVFPQESKVKVFAKGDGNFTAPEGEGLRAHWQFLLEDGSKQMNSISIVCNETEKERWVLIEDRRFELQSGNLFCVFLNADLEFAHAEQLNETITTKATIADFKRLLPDNPAVQAIRTN